MLLGVSIASVPIRFGRRQTCVILGTHPVNFRAKLIARLPFKLSYCVLQSKLERKR